jgi:hypothetical protein
MSGDSIITLQELEEEGFTEGDLRRCCPLAPEYKGLQGERCWRRSDLVDLLGCEEESQ